MLKSVLGFVSTLCLVAGCAAPQPVANSQPAGQSTAVATVDSTPQGSEPEYDTVFVPPPVGSMLGGGSVRVPKKYAGTDERALNGNIRSLNAAAGSQVERPFVVSAVARATGVSEQALQAQQDSLRLRFGELCAINAIARGNTTKVKEIANLRSQGRSWTDLSEANGVNVATVAQVTRNATDLTVSSYSNAAERRKGGGRKLREAGVRTQSNPGE